MSEKNGYRSINNFLKFYDAYKWLDDIANIKENWNGYGAHPFSAEHIEHVKSILDWLSGQNMECPIVNPTARNSIQIEWRVGESKHHDGEEKYLEIEVYADGHIETFMTMDLDNVPIDDVVELYHRWIEEDDE